MAKHKLYKSQPKICWRGRNPDLSFVWQFLIQSIIVILKNNIELNNNNKKRENKKKRENIYLFE